MTGSMRRFLMAATASAMLIALTACNIHVDKDDKGKEKRVDITTPMGSLNVRNDNATAKDTGLAVYPGASIKPAEEHSDNKANVNIDTPFFGLKVVAMTYTTPDDPQKVLAWYRDQMKSYGKFVECKGHYDAKGAHDKSDLDKPVTCDDQVTVKGDISDDSTKQSGSNGVELKAGTNGNQHVVAVKPRDKGTEFSLIYVRVHGGKEDSI